MLPLFEAHILITGLFSLFLRSHIPIDNEIRVSHGFQILPAGDLPDILHLLKKDVSHLAGRFACMLPLEVHELDVVRQVFGAYAAFGLQSHAGQRNRG